LSDISGGKVQWFKSSKVQLLKVLAPDDTRRSEEQVFLKTLTLNINLKSLCQQKKLAFATKFDLYSTSQNLSK
jgi:hypothetical protein